MILWAIKKNTGWSRPSTALAIVAGHIGTVGDLITNAINKLLSKSTAIATCKAIGNVLVSLSTASIVALPLKN